MQSKRSLFGVEVSCPATVAGAWEGVHGKSTAAARAAWGSKSEADKLNARNAFLKNVVYEFRIFCFLGYVLFYGKKSFGL